MMCNSGSAQNGKFIIEKYHLKLSIFIIANENIYTLHQLNYMKVTNKIKKKGNNTKVYRFFKKYIEIYFRFHLN